MKAPGLRLTGGTARGARLHSVPGLDVRPALARMRVSVFEILRPRLEGARALDLFAGTGCLGLEALSRGAARCVFIDADPRCVETLRKNLAKLRFEDRAVVKRGSAFDAVRLVGEERFDLVFVDPPYAFYDERGAELEAAVEALGPRVEPGALVLVEHRAAWKAPGAWAGGRQVDERAYGGTVVSFYARK